MEQNSQKTDKGFRSRNNLTKKTLKDDKSDLYEDVITRNFQIISDLLKKLNSLFIKQEQFDTELQNIHKKLLKFDTEMDNIHAEHRRDNLCMFSNIDIVKGELNGIDNCLRMLIKDNRSIHFFNDISPTTKYKSQDALITPKNSADNTFMKALRKNQNHHDGAFEEHPSNIELSEKQLERQSEVGQINQNSHPQNITHHRKQIPDKQQKHLETSSKLNENIKYQRRQSDFRKQDIIVLNRVNFETKKITEPIKLNKEKNKSFAKKMKDNKHENYGSRHNLFRKSSYKFDEMQVINHNRVDEKALTHEYKKENSHKRNKSKISNMPNRQSTIEQGEQSSSSNRFLVEKQENFEPQKTEKVLFKNKNLKSINIASKIPYTASVSPHRTQSDQSEQSEMGDQSENKRPHNNLEFHDKDSSVSILSILMNELSYYIRRDQYQVDNKKMDRKVKNLLYECSDIFADKLETRKAVVFLDNKINKFLNFFSNEEIAKELQKINKEVPLAMSKCLACKRPVMSSLSQNMEKSQNKNNDTVQAYNYKDLKKRTMEALKIKKKKNLYCRNSLY